MLQYCPKKIHSTDYSVGHGSMIFLFHEKQELLLRARKTEFSEGTGVSQMDTEAGEEPIQKAVHELCREVGIHLSLFSSHGGTLHTIFLE